MSGQATAGAPGPGLGTAAEEAARLFEALQDWARRTGAGASEHIATGSAECQLCPLCQLLSLARAAQPEVFAHLSDASASLLSAVRAAMDAHERDWAARRGTVEHIDIG